MLMDGLGVVNKLMGGGKRQIGRQELVQDGGRQQTIGHLGKQKNQQGYFEINSTEKCWSKNLEGVGSREREGGEDHE